VEIDADGRMEVEMVGVLEREASFEGLVDPEGEIWSR